MNKLYLSITVASLTFISAANAQNYVVNGITYSVTTPTETVIVPPTGFQTAQSANKYSGYVLVAGSGQWVYAVDGIARNDLLYYFNSNNSGNGNLLPMFFGTAPITSASETSIAPYDGSYPAYNTSHTYTFIANTQVSNPSTLYFGVGDSDYVDNTGSLSVKITQLQPVLSAPVFILQPVSQIVSPGQTVTFSAQAVGYPIPAYQWQFDGTNVSGATNTNYTIPSAALTNIGYYTVVASNSVNTNASSAASLGFISLNMLAAIYVTGPNGANYQIQATPTVGPTNWTVLTNIIIASQPYIYVDYSTPTNSKQFYRAVPQ